MPQPLTITFAVHKETRNKMRFREVVMTPDTEPLTVQPAKAVCEALYVSKVALKKLGNPKALKVTVEALQ